MRFEVGSQVPFVHVKFSHPNGYSNADGLSFMTYHPWDHTLLGIDILMLTCDEHHKVPKEYVGEEKVEDGFIFSDQDKNIWHNQWPVANGQNMLVERDITSEAHLDSEMARGVVNFEMKALSQYLQDVARGVYTLEDAHRKDSSNEKAIACAIMLQAHYDDVVQKFEAMTGQKVIREERRFGGLFRGWYNVTFELLQAA
jgi:hypothetical protein